MGDPLLGALRWFAALDVAVEGPDPFEHKGERVVPKSRSFIPSAVEDNPFLAATNYKAMLQALPEPLRSQMLRGGSVAAGSGRGRSIERHETVVERLGIALAKERRGRRRPERIAGYEAELRRHLDLLARMREG